MRLLQFSAQYPDEAACIAKLREEREKDEHVCPRCGCTQWYWKRDKLAYECKHCHRRESIRRGTVMEFSKLPFQYWFQTMHFLTSTVNSFSALELQKQLGHKYYQPIWEMLHKLRNVMGKRDGIYMLKGNVEIAQSSFATVLFDKANPEVTKLQKKKAAKTKVLVMAESEPGSGAKPGHKARTVHHLKMRVVPDLKAETVNDVVQKSLAASVRLLSDPKKVSVGLLQVLKTHVERPLSTAARGKMLPWGHIIKTNAKTRLVNLYHGVKVKFLQLYLNEFCYKFNRRKLDEDRFDNLVNVATHYTSDFKHQVYGKSQNRRSSS